MCYNICLVLFNVEFFELVLIVFKGVNILLLEWFRGGGLKGICLVLNLKLVKI